jgi:hypothetical protein
MPISPNQGSTGGGTTVTLTGTNLSGAIAVHFGSKPATITADTATSITAVSPSGTGTVGVTVTTPGGTSSPLSYFYVGAPFKATLSPVAGATAGGNTVTITGTGLSTATAVHFGANSATPTVVNDSQLTVTVPAGTAAGAVGVSITTAGGTTNGLSYTYVAVPTLTSLSPSSGSVTGATTLTLTGTNLTGATAVTFGATAATSFTVNSATQITAVAPAGTGTVSVTVTTPGGTSNGLSFSYVAVPTLTSVSPSSGLLVGGTSVTLTGTNLTGATAVTFGATAATSFTVNSATQITAVAPAGPLLGAVSVTVTTAGGTSNGLSYTYI